MPFRPLSLSLVLGLLCVGSPAEAAGELVPTAQALKPLGLETHDVRVTITDGLAVTEVTQTFFNQHEQSIEAMYRFPLPRGAAVSGCSLWIDGEEVQGEVVKRARAEAIRAAQRRRGRDVATVEQRGFRGFQVRVSPIRPRARQTVRLIYYQPLEIDQGVGRYVYPLTPGNTEHTRRIFDERPVQARVRIGAELRSTLPLVDVATPGWPGARVVAVSQRVASEDEWGEAPAGAERRRVYLEARDVRLEHDFVLYWRTAAQTEPRLAVVPHRAAGAEEGTFLLTLDPGLHGVAPAPAQDWVLLLDVSGSMGGAKLELAKEAARELLEGLGPGDRFTLLTFNNEVRHLSPARRAATPPNVARALDALRAVRAGGGTGVHGALQAALGAAARRPTGVLLLTDGVANVGPQSLRALQKLIRGRDVRVFAFEVGNESNGPLLDFLADTTGGFHMDLSAADLMEGRVSQARAKLSHPSLRDVEVRVEGVSVSGLTPARLPAIYAGQALRLLGRYRGSGPARVTLRGTRAGEPMELSAVVELPAVAAAAPELERLWALSQVRDLQRAMELSGGRSTLGRQRIEALALRYGLVTPYTSLVVVPKRDKALHSLGDGNARRVERERRARQRAQPAGPRAYGSSAVLRPNHKPPAPLGTARRTGPRLKSPAPRPSRATPVVEPLPREEPFRGPGATRARSDGGGYWSGGGGGGGGSLGPLGALLALVLGGARRRREAAA